MTKRLSADERLRRAMDRVVESQMKNFRTSVCIAQTYRGECGLAVYKDGQRPWAHVNTTARHKVVLR